MARLTAGKRVPIDHAARCFDSAWADCENEGCCDGMGGAEYRRVRREWYRAGRPVGIACFIAARSNIACDDRSAGPEG